MDGLEELLKAQRASLERFVRFRVGPGADADDILQEVYLTACQKFSQLRSRDSFRAWLFCIAANRCRDYFRRKAAEQEIPLEVLPEQALSDGRQGAPDTADVRETLAQLCSRDKQILYLYYWQELPQAEIARRLHIPPGTVKSRLHTARQRFKDSWPCPDPKGERNMKKKPERLPACTIEADSRPPFSVRWEELMGWFLIPRLGEKLTWGMYEIPSRRCTYVYEMRVTGKATVHGVEGVELTAKETPCTGKKETIRRTFVAQLTPTHCRYLAVVRTEGDVRRYLTFLDGDAFLSNWGFGEDNCGNEIQLTARGDIRRDGAAVTSAPRDFLVDIVGRAAVTVGGKIHDTVCVMNIEKRGCDVISEQYLDREGKTVLWRRFNRDDWAFDHYGRRWSELLPDNERITVNGATYVHWYDCITDRVL